MLSASENLDQLLLSGLIDEAEEALSTQLKLNPQDPELLSKKALILFRKGKNEELFQLMEKLEQKKKNDLEFKKSLLGLAYLLNKKEKVEALLTELFKKDTQNPDLAFGLSGYFFNTGRFQEAADVMATYYARTRDVKALRVQAHALLHAGKLKEAREALKEYKKQHPMDAEAFLLEGHILAAMNDCRRAILAYKEALDLGLKRASVPLSLCASQRGEYQTVKRHMEEVIKFKESAPFLSTWKQKAFYQPPSFVSYDGYLQKENRLFKRWKQRLTASTFFSQGMQGSLFFEDTLLEHRSFGKKRFRRKGLDLFLVFHPVAFSLSGDTFHFSGGVDAEEGQFQLSWLRDRTTAHFGAGSGLITEGLLTFQTLQRQMKENYWFASFHHKLKDGRTKLEFSVFRSTYSDGNKRTAHRLGVAIPLMESPRLTLQFSVLRDRFDFASPFYYSEPEALTGVMALEAHHTMQALNLRLDTLVSAARLQTPGRVKESDYLEWIFDLEHPLSQTISLRAGYHGNSAPTFFYQIFRIGLKATF